MMGGSGHEANAAPEAPFAGRRQYGFPKAMRLRKRPEFLAVQQTGEKFHGRHFLAVIAPRARAGEVSGSGRVGITVSKKIGNAVTRNRIKRLVREHMRRTAWALAGMDAVIIAKASAAELVGYDDAARDLSRILDRVQAHTRARTGARPRSRPSP